MRGVDGRTAPRIRATAGRVCDAEEPNPPLTWPVDINLVDRMAESVKPTGKDIGKPSQPQRSESFAAIPGLSCGGINICAKHNVSGNISTAIANAIDALKRAIIRRVCVS